MMYDKRYQQMTDDEEHQSKDDFGRAELSHFYNRAHSGALDRLIEKMERNETLMEQPQPSFLHHRARAAWAEKRKPIEVEQRSLENQYQSMLKKIEGRENVQNFKTFHNPHDDFPEGMEEYMTKPTPADPTGHYVGPRPDDNWMAEVAPRGQQEEQQVPKGRAPARFQPQSVPTQRQTMH